MLVKVVELKECSPLVCATQILRTISLPIIFRCLIFGFLLLVGYFTSGNAEPLLASNKNISTSLSLNDAIEFGVRNNRNIKTAYLQRISQKFDLYVSEGKFYPRLNLSTSFTTNNDYGIRSNKGVMNTVATISLPTGATITASSAKYNGNGSISPGVTSLTITQPLLRNGGIEVNTASIRAARIDDQVSRLYLKTVVSQTVIQIIYAYRELLKAQEQKKICEGALKRSRELYEINKLLIASGRMAEVELIQTEADVANQEVVLEEANNQIDTSRMALLNLLALDPSTAITTSSTDTFSPKEQSIEESVDIALQNQPDYQISLFAVQKAIINLDFAKNQRLWDVSLIAGKSRVDGNIAILSSNGIDPVLTQSLSSSYVGLQVSVPFADRTLEQAVVQASVSLDSLKIRKQEIRQIVEQRTRDALRNVQTRWRQFELSKKAKNLAIQKLITENEKLKVGRTSNFQILAFENDLRNAENSQLNAEIAYLNALTDLDDRMGRVLDIWQIPITDDKNLVNYEN